MLKVPTDADNPAFDSTFTVSFWRWLRSGRSERHEWMRRHNAALLERSRRWDERKVAADDNYAEARIMYAEGQGQSGR